MQLGFVSAILPDLSLPEVANFAASASYECIELMCWPVGKAERRYAGVTHIDVNHLNEEEAGRILEHLTASDLFISGLGYYPNPLTPDLAEGKAYAEHIRKVIDGCRLLHVPVMNTFLGRDWAKSVDDNWPRLLETWKPIIAYAEEKGVKVAIEHCPMFFTKDEWPGGKNLGVSPSQWRRMFSDIDSPNFGLNFDPSHFIWQHMDYLRALREFSSKLFHVHAKDARIDRHRLDEVGILAHPLEYHTPKLPGLGDVDWGKFFSVLGDVGYKGPVCVEVEDRSFEDSLDGRKQALRISARYLRQYIGA